MAQPLSQIYASLNGGGYDQSRAAINQQMSTLPSYYQAQQQGLDQTEANQFQNINNDAAARGMTYSGAPIKEEQQYVGGTYLPAVAQLKQQQNDQTYGLQQALAGVNTNQTNAAQGILQNQIQNDQQNNYYNQMLQQNAQYNQRMAGMYGGSGSGGQQAPTQNQVLASAFQGFDPNKKWQTEQQIAPAIQSALNLPYQQALNLAYNYRKQVYHS